MADFLWHKVSESEKKEIQKQAKEIMDNFSKKLAVVETKLKEEPLIERSEGERPEGSGKSDNSFDKKIMLENAPKSDGEFIIAERAEW
ncbi:MAG TPA: hypothetical protein VJH65_04015 [Candidatus Nanoarchaeia archaeon]|nr:hypothetical protein [Candidatus Nanoarchaeia archaeon]